MGRAPPPLGETLWKDRKKSHKALKNVPSLSSCCTLKTLGLEPNQQTHTQKSAAKGPGPASNDFQMKGPKCFKFKQMCVSLPLPVSSPVSSL